MIKLIIQLYNNYNIKMTINMYTYGCVTKNNEAVAYFPLILLRDKFRNKNEIYFDKVYISLFLDLKQMLRLNV